GNCSQACDHSTFELNIMQSEFTFGINFGNSMKVAFCDISNRNVDIDVCYEWNHYNGLELQVYFETLKVHTFTQRKTNPPTGFLAASKFIGRSMITNFCLGLLVAAMLQLVLFLILCIIRRF
ncbi:hypothetical protein PENTCL1PPCAC_7748, partial [Pristionchus entomophagus]